MSNENPPETKRLTDDEIVERARRAMVRASDKAMEDYKRFGIEPVLSPTPIEPAPKKSQK